MGLNIIFPISVCYANCVTYVNSQDPVDNLPMFLKNDSNLCKYISTLF